MRSGLPPPLDHPARQLLFGTHQTAVRRALGREITPVVRYDDRDSFVEPRRDGPRQLAGASEPVVQLDMRQLMRGNIRFLPRGIDPVIAGGAARYATAHARQ